MHNLWLTQKWVFLMMGVCLRNIAFIKSIAFISSPSNPTCPLYATATPATTPCHWQDKWVIDKGVDKKACFFICKNWVCDKNIIDMSSARRGPINDRGGGTLNYCRFFCIQVWTSFKPKCFCGSFCLQQLPYWNIYCPRFSLKFILSIDFIYSRAPLRQRAVECCAKEGE